MKLRLQKVTKSVKRGGKSRCAVDNIDFTLRSGDRTALVACRGGDAGLLCAMLAGTEKPDRGEIYREGTVSWPLPRAKFLPQVIAGGAAARFVARIHGVDGDQYLKKILSIADVKKFLPTKLKQWPPLQRGEFLAAMGISLDFDFYIIESNPIGRPQFMENWKKAIRQLGKKRGFLIVASHPKHILDICDQVYILDGNRLLHFSDVEGALEYCADFSGEDFRVKVNQERADTEEEDEDAGMDLI